MDNLIGNQQRAFLPIPWEHYGYGDPSYHFNKQWARMEALEGRVRVNPYDLHARMYLVCCMSVLQGGTNIPDFDRLNGHVQISIEQFLNGTPKVNWLQGTMQRIMRHFWGVC